jgi:predicted Zn-dependent protease with MMP-like domain
VELDVVKGFFCICLDDQVVFVFASISVRYYIYRFVYVEPPLHPWDEVDLVLVDDLSAVLLESVNHYFIKDFYIDIH